MGKCATLLHFASKRVHSEDAACGARAVRNNARIDKSPLLGAVSPLGAWELSRGTKARGFSKVHQFNGPHQRPAGCCDIQPKPKEPEIKRPCEFGLD